MLIPSSPDPEPAGPALPAPSTPRRGVYFLASDSVHDLVLTMLASLRAHNPDLPVCLIPFDDRIERLRALQVRFGFTVFDRAEVLAACDGIADHFFAYGQRPGHFRKLAAWEGAFEEFVFVDTDTVVLQDLGRVMDLLRDHDFVFSHSTMPSLRQWVWKPSMDRTGELTAEQIAFSANTGFFVSRRGALPLQDVLRRLPRAASLRSHMVLFCFEQPLLNYLVVTSGRAYTSLHDLAQRQGRNDLPQERWGGTAGGRVTGGGIQFPDRKPVLLVHWAGCWRATRLDRWWTTALNRLRRRQKEPPTVRRWMKYRKLWRHYHSLARAR